MSLNNVSPLIPHRSLTYHQSSQPSNPNAGDGWYDTSTGIYRVYADQGDGFRWQAVPPVKVLREASTFQESDVTLTFLNGQYTFTSGSIGIANNPTEQFDDGNINPDDIAPVSDWTGSTSAISGGSGDISISPTNTVYLDVEAVNGLTADIEFTAQRDSDTSNVNKFPIFRNSNGNIIMSVRYKGNENAFQFNGANDNDLETLDLKKRTYRILWDWANDQASIDVDGTTYGPFSFANSSDGVYEMDFSVEDTLTMYNMSLDAVYSSATVYVEWGAPSDIDSWDLATFQRTLNNESVDIYVAESSDGGSTWSRINGGNPIGQNFDISTIDPANEVRIECELSRSNTSNDPTFDYAATRYVR
jgi:hypothetical protein